MDTYQNMDSALANAGMAGNRMGSANNVNFHVKFANLSQNAYNANKIIIYT